VNLRDTVFTAALEDNSSVQALRELLAKGSLIINLSDYGNIEKVGPIGQLLPKNNEQITTTKERFTLTESQFRSV